MSSNTELIELRRMAEAATPGIWSAVRHDMGIFVYCQNDYLISGPVSDRPDGDGNAAFIAVANPAKIIELLDAIEAQAKQIEVLRKDWKKVSDENGFLRFEQAKQLEALQADAGRYRWLRSCNLAKHQAVRGGFELGDEKLDAAIDAARKQGGA